MGSEGKKTTGGGTRGRVYDAMLDWHLRRDRQMAFVAGPRQVGKTTTTGTTPMTGPSSSPARPPRPSDSRSSGCDPGLR